MSRAVLSSLSSPSPSSPVPPRAPRPLWLLLVIAACGGSPAQPDAPPPPDAPPDGPIDPLGCNPTTGLAAPLHVCSPAEPCTRVAFDLADRFPTQITLSSEPPRCRTTNPARARVFDDGPPLAATDAAGVVRYHCQFVPAGTSASARRPLVVFVHGGGGGEADDVYNYTSLREKAQMYDLSGDPARPGFVLVSIQGRFLHYPTRSPRDGHHNDFYFRDLRSPSTNPDVANVDRIIDGLVATGQIDPRRIYLMGWSNGTFFSQLYGVARHERGTPGGNVVAAIAGFSGADPFHNVNRDQSPSCQLAPYPRSQVPIFLVGRTCDLVACDATQAAMFAAAGELGEPGHVFAPWLADLAAKVGDPNVQQLIVAGNGTVVGGCNHDPTTCTPAAGLRNHMRWPDGVADGSGLDHEPAMLGYLRAHPAP